MKYLHDDALAELTALLTDCPVSNNVRSNSRTVHGRLEAYTMKRAGSDKKYAVQLSHRYAADLAAAAEEIEQRHQREISWMIMNNSNNTNNNNNGTGSNNNNEGKNNNNITISGRKRSMSTGEAFESSKLLLSRRAMKKTAYSNLLGSNNNSNKNTDNIDHGADAHSSKNEEELAEGCNSKTDVAITTKATASTGSRRGRSYSLDVPLQRAVSAPSSSSSSSITLTIPDFKAMSWAAREGYVGTHHSGGTLVGNSNAAAGGGGGGMNRRLLTDLILTLNHSFPDYDFAAATAADFKVTSLETAVTRINKHLSELAATNFYNNSSTAITSNSSCNSGSSASNMHHHNRGTNFLSNLWTAVDKVITLSQVTAVYSYQPADENSLEDPFSFLKASLLSKNDATEDGVDDDIMDSSEGRVPVAHHTLDSRRQSRPYDQLQHHSILRQHRHRHPYSDDSDADDDTALADPRVAGEVLWAFNYFFVNKQTKRILLFTCIETMLRSGYSEDDPGAFESPTSATTNSASHGTSGKGIAGGAAAASHRISHRAYSGNGHEHDKNRIPEDDTVYHDGSLLESPYGGGGNFSNSNISGSSKYHRRSTSMTSSSPEDDDDDSDDGGNDRGSGLCDDTASSAVSVDDLDWDPAASGGIPIGTA